jgi:uncharacterized protein (DUF433 family)
VKIKVADEVWIATALLHREHPEREAFRVSEIVARIDQEGLHRPRRPGVQVHASLHCVANKEPNPATYRMLYEAPEGGRRLFRAGDSAHPARQGKIVPRPEDIPAAYHDLLRWYHEVYNQAGSGEQKAGAPPAEYRAAASVGSRLIRETGPTNGSYDWRERIVVDPAILVGKPVVKGTRLAVAFIVDLLACGWSEAEILRNYPGLSHEDVMACLAYASAVLQAEQVFSLRAG